MNLIESLTLFATRRLPVGRYAALTLLKRLGFQSLLEKGGSLRTATLKGTEVELLLDISDPVGLSVYAIGEHYDYAGITVMCRILPHCSTFIDVGANIGVFTCLGARALREGGSVLAFEPHPGLFERLENNVSRNELSFVECINCALAVREGTGSLTRRGETVGTFSLLPGETGSETSQVRIQPFEPFAAKVNWQDTVFVKIDTEGYEGQVVDSILRSTGPDASPIFQIEITDRWLRRVGGGAAELFKSFHDRGYSAYCILMERSRLLARRVVLRRIDEPLPDEQYNCLFARDEHVALFQSLLENKGNA